MRLPDLESIVRFGALLLALGIVFRACTSGEACGLASANPDDGGAIVALFVLVPLAIVGYAWIRRRLRGERREQDRTFTLPRHRALPLPPGNDDVGA